MPALTMFRLRNSPFPPLLLLFAAGLFCLWSWQVWQTARQAHATAARQLDDARRRHRERQELSAQLAAAPEIARWRQRGVLASDRDWSGILDALGSPEREFTYELTPAGDTPSPDISAHLLQIEARMNQPQGWPDLLYALDRQAPAVLLAERCRWQRPADDSLLTGNCQLRWLRPVGDR